MGDYGRINVDSWTKNCVILVWHILEIGRNKWRTVLWSVSISAFPILFYTTFFLSVCVSIQIYTYVSNTENYELLPHTLHLGDVVDDMSMTVKSKSYLIYRRTRGCVHMCHFCVCVYVWIHAWKTGRNKCILLIYLLVFFCCCFYYLYKMQIYIRKTWAQYMGIYLKNLSFSVVYIYSNIVQTYIQYMDAILFTNKNNVIYFFFQFSCAIVCVYTNFYRYITTHQ